jgi:hypothetical protein
MDTVDIAFGELTIRFSGRYSEGEDDVYTLPNGDPGYPGVPSSFEWEVAHLLDASGRPSAEVTDFISELLSLDDDSLADKLVEAHEESLEDDDEPHADDLPDDDDDRGGFL